MRSKYWIKLYHEILTDPKMGRLPDNEWRRCIELFLLAGEIKKGGQLPDTEDIAWYLHIDAAQLQGELEHLQQVGIITKNDDGWYVDQFAKRQAPVSDAERQRLYRRRQGIEDKPNTSESEPEQAKPEQPEEITEPLQDGNDIVTRSVTNRNTVTNRNVDNRLQITDSRLQIVESGAKKRAPPPPALYLYNEITGYHKITRYWRLKIADTVGDERKSLELWAAVIKGWTGKGWFEGNIEGMLDYYNRGEVPGDRKNGAKPHGPKYKPKRQEKSQKFDPASVEQKRAEVEAEIARIRDAPV